ncbi:hypothetical protein ACL00T_14730 [Curtobacterium flaccumfaciens]
MMTTSLMASQVSMVPAKPEKLAADALALEPLDLVRWEPQQPVGLHGVPDERVTLEGDAAVAEPLRRRQESGGVRGSALGLEAAPVERECRGVEDVGVEVGEVLGACFVLRFGVGFAGRFAVGQSDEVEADVAEGEGMAGLLDGDVGIGDGIAFGIDDRQGRLAEAVLWCVRHRASSDVVVRDLLCAQT